jgi:predicted Zn finger-like uncharacterized protein
MPNTICPHCGANGRVPDTFIGRRVKCPKCQQPFTVAAAAAPPAPAAPRQAAPASPTPPPRAVSPRPAPPPPPAQEDALEEIGDEVAAVADAGAAPVTAGGGVRYLRAYQYIFENPKWVTNVLLLAVCYLIPVVGPLVGSGYLFDLTEWISTRGDAGYPDFDFGRFGKYLMRGLWPFLVSLILYLPVWMILGVVGVAMAFVLPDIVQHLYALVEYVVLLLLLPLAMMPLWLRTGLSQSLDLGATFQFAQDFFKRVGKEAVVGQLFMTFSGVVLSLLGFMLCCVGVYAALAVTVMAYANLYAQLYQLYLQRGGQPIPLKQEVPADAGGEPGAAV